MFEGLLMKRFPATKESGGGGSQNQNNFDKIIWSVFDRHMAVFVRTQHKSLEQFLTECAGRIRSNEERPKRETNTTAVPLPSSANLFLLIKKIITESSKLFSRKDDILMFE
jgi:hypothetical protein